MISGFYCVPFPKQPKLFRVFRVFRGLMFFIKRMQQTTRIYFPDKFQVALETADRTSHEHELLVKNRYSLISPGTELALYTGTHVGFSDPEIAWAKFPIFPGYASVGSVEQKVTTPLFSQDARLLHFSPHSSYSVIDPQKTLWFLLPHEIDEKAALFARFAQISATAVNVRHIEPHAVLVFGAGLIGNLCAQLYQVKGQSVILADISEKRLHIAQQCGIQKIVNSAAPDFEAQLQTLSDGRGVDFIVEATGVPALVNQALEIVNDYGEVLLLGSTRGTVEINVYKHIHRKKTMLTGVHESYFPLKSDSGLSHESLVKQVLAHIAAREILTAPLITHEIAPHEVKEAYEGLLHDKENYLGVIIGWNK